MTEETNQDGYCGEKGKMKDDLIAKIRTKNGLNPHFTRHVYSDEAGGNEILHQSGFAFIPLAGQLNFTCLQQAGL